MRMERAKVLLWLHAALTCLRGPSSGDSVSMHALWHNTSAADV